MFNLQRLEELLDEFTDAMKENTVQLRRLADAMDAAHDEKLIEKQGLP